MVAPYGMEPEFTMNCISGPATRSPSLSGKRRWIMVLGAIAVAACGVESSESADTPKPRDYHAHYAVEVDPSDASVRVSISVRQSRHALREMSFPVGGSLGEFSGDGDWRVENGSLRWLLPVDGGELRWKVRVPHKRSDDAYDAWLNASWGLFRAEDIIPRARTRALKKSTANTTLSFRMPAGWSVVTEYSGRSNAIRVNRAERRFDQPTGWIVMGDIGVRRETIAGVRVAVAGPLGQGVRRMDMLALLNWTLPELAAVLPKMPKRLTIVSAAEPMWRGGLSAPASLFVHAGLPLISENATSPLLHEIVHVALSLRTSKGADWITEGLAEYYGLEFLKRGGAITARRHAAAISEQADWAKQADALCVASSTGPTTALAVTVMRALNSEIVDKTDGKSSLDDVVRQLVASTGAIDVAELSGIAAEIIGEPSDALHIDRLPGCSNMAFADHGG